MKRDEEYVDKYIWNEMFDKCKFIYLEDAELFSPSSFLLLDSYKLYGNCLHRQEEEVGCGGEG
jgi:hypothetical protein